MKELRTKFIGDALVAAKTPYLNDVMGQWTLQDDIIIIGVLLSVELGGMAPAEGQWAIDLELTRAGRLRTDSVISKLEKGYDDGAAGGTHQNTYSQSVVMFPEPYGIYVDRGATLSLIVTGGGVGTFFTDPSAIIYYIDR